MNVAFVKFEPPYLAYILSRELLKNAHEESFVTMAISKYS
jgi:hypothetical protein